MRQRANVRLHLVDGEDEPVTDSGHRPMKRKQVERVAVLRGKLVAVRRRGGGGWDELFRYDPSDR